MAQTIQRQGRLFNDVDPRFGGSRHGKGNPKTARPLSVKQPIHLVLKSEMATGAKSMLAPDHVDEIRKILTKQCEKFGVRVYHYANGGNHLHLVLKIHSPRLFKSFLRAATGLIARQVLNAQKNAPKLKEGKLFWAARPFTRIASWGRDYKDLVRYILINNLEAIGFMKQQARGRNAKSARDEIITLKVKPDD